MGSSTSFVNDSCLCLARYTDDAAEYMLSSTLGTAAHGLSKYRSRTIAFLSSDWPLRTKGYVDYVLMPTGPLHGLVLINCLDDLYLRSGVERRDSTITRHNHTVPRLS